MMHRREHETKTGFGNAAADRVSIGFNMMPRAANASAAPEREERARLPCLATGTPAPATTNAEQLETL
jgi:hypothetical protein